MKQQLFFLIFLFLFSLVIKGENENVVRVGEWGSGPYESIAVKNNYAYCFTNDGESSTIDIIDISKPTQPVKVGSCNTPGDWSERFVYGDYLYAVTNNNELVVLDISDPLAPKPVSNYGKDKNIRNVFVSGHYAYCIRGYNETLMILDISEPAEIKEISNYQPQDYNIYGVYVSGNYVYLNGYRKMEIVDISNPAAPVLKGVYDYGPYHGDDFESYWYGSEIIKVNGGYAYIILVHEQYPGSDFYIPGLFIIDISNPAKPTRIGFLDLDLAVVTGFFEPQVSGDYAHAAEGSNDLYFIILYNDLYVINISDPSSPRILGKYDTGRDLRGFFVRDNYVYLAAEVDGLLVVKAANPANPTLVGRFDESGLGNEVIVRGDYAFMARYGSGLEILDISSPAAPVRVGNFATDDAGDVELYGDYAYLAHGGDENGIWVINISNPASPFKTAQIPTSSSPQKLMVSGHYLYAAAGSHKVLVFDITEPSAPTQVTSFETQGWIDDFYISGNYLYLAGSNGLSILDISNPSAPIQVGNCDIGGVIWSAAVHGNYAYVTGIHLGIYLGLNVIDVSVPGNPVKVGHSDYNATSLYAAGNYLYLLEYKWDSDQSLRVFDISNPIVPRLAGGYQSGPDPTSVYKSGEYLYLTNSKSGKLSILKFTEGNKPAQLTLSRSYIHFAGTTAYGLHTSPQTILISNPGDADVHWSITKESPDSTNWLSFTPTSGTNSGEITISVNPDQLWYICSCTYEATLEVSSPEAATKTIKVDLRMWDSDETLEPFGEFATPLDGSIVSGSIPVTGWALDDLEVKSVGIYREINSGLVYIGDGIFVEGARPDVDNAYSWFPLNYRAGWGYMLLTNYMPDGPITLHAVATDLEGNQVTLGTKTITVDNKNAVKPFGTIDTPAPGEYVSGSNYLNWGWAITPQPNTIPLDGSTITVWVDGIPIGHPVYNQYREDIAAYFPGYNNSSGAVGYFYLDTFAFINGVHTIAWSVTDDYGNSDGIGSRFFTIANTGSKGIDQNNAATPFNYLTTQPLTSLFKLEKIPLEELSSLEFVKGYNRECKPGIALADNHGLIRLRIRQLERLELHLNPMNGMLMEDSTGTSDMQKEMGIKENPGETFTGFQVVGKQLKSLPIGSYLDPGSGIFYWLPGAGFVGTYRLVFIHTDRYGARLRKGVDITIVPH